VGQHPDGALTAAPPTPRGASVGFALRSRSFWLATLAFGANGWTLYFALLHLPRLARDTGAGMATGGQLLAVAAATSALTMLAIGPLARRAGKRRTAAALFAARALVLAAAAAFATDAAHLFVVAAAFGVTGFPVIPLMMGLITERFGTHVLGGVLGIVFVSHQLFAGAGVLTGGLLRQAAGGYDAALLAGVAVSLAGIALLAALDDPAASRSRQDLVLRDRTHPSPILEGGTP
jgi:MFS family permease